MRSPQTAEQAAESRLMWVRLEMASEAELEAVRQVAQDHPVVWAWFRKVLSSKQRLRLNDAISSDGDASTRARGAVVALQELLDHMSAVNEGLARNDEVKEYEDGE